MMLRATLIVTTFILSSRAVAATGGETIETATLIGGLPYADTGITCGHINDYDEACPYTGSTAPDLVYAYQPNRDMIIDIDLCESDYDTKVYVYAGGVDSLIACNDDFWGCGQVDWESRIEALYLYAGTAIYVVVDGHGSACGAYDMLIVGEEVPVPVAPLGWGEVKSMYRESAR